MRAAGNGGNLLLNIGPRPDGTIQPEAAQRLREIGQWLATFGPTLYATRAGPVPPRSWGATTRRGDSVFVHVLDWPDRTLALPALGARVVAASMFGGRERVEFSQTDAGVTLSVPSPSGREPDRVVVLQMAPGK